MPRERNDRDVVPFEFRVGAGAGPALGGMHRRGSPSEVPPHKFWTAINTRVRPEGLVSRDGLVEDLDTGSAKPIDGMAVPPDEDAGMGEKLIGLTFNLASFFRAGEIDADVPTPLIWKPASLSTWGGDIYGAGGFMAKYMRDTVYRPMVQDTYRIKDPNPDVFLNVQPPTIQKQNNTYAVNQDWYRGGGIARPWCGPMPFNWVAPDANGIYQGGGGSWNYGAGWDYGLGNLLHYRGLLTHVGWRFYPKGNTVPTGDPWTVPGWELCLALAELHFPVTLDKAGSANWTKLATPDLVGDTAGTGLMDVAVRRYRIGDDRMNEILTLAVRQDDGTLKVFDWDGTTFTDSGLTPVSAGSGSFPGVATAALGRVGETGLFLICQYFAPQTNAAVAYYQEEPGAAWTTVTLPANFVCYGIVGAAHEGIYFDYGTIGDWTYTPSTIYPTARCSYLQHKLGFWKPSMPALSMIRNWWTQDSEKRMPLTSAGPEDEDGVGPINNIQNWRQGVTPYYTRASQGMGGSISQTSHGMYFWKNRLYIWVSTSYPLGWDQFDGGPGDYGDGDDIDPYQTAWYRDADDEPAQLDSWDGTTYTERLNLGISYPYRRFTDWTYVPGPGWQPGTTLYGLTDFYGGGFERTIEVEPGVVMRCFDHLGPVGSISGGINMKALIHSPLFDGSGGMYWWLAQISSGFPPGEVAESTWPLPQAHGTQLGVVDLATGAWGTFYRPGVDGAGAADENIFSHGPAEELEAELLEGFDRPGL